MPILHRKWCEQHKVLFLFLNSDHKSKNAEDFTSIVWCFPSSNNDNTSMLKPQFCPSQCFLHLSLPSCFCPIIRARCSRALSHSSLICLCTWECFFSHRTCDDQTPLGVLVGICVLLFICQCSYKSSKFKKRVKDDWICVMLQGNQMERAFFEHWCMGDTMFWISCWRCVLRPATAVLVVSFCNPSHSGKQNKSLFCSLNKFNIATDIKLVWEQMAMVNDWNRGWFSFFFMSLSAWYFLGLFMANLCYFWNS